jgi:hypothetical protein
MTNLFFDQRMTFSSVQLEPFTTSLPFMSSLGFYVSNSAWKFVWFSGIRKLGPSWNSNFVSTWHSQERIKSFLVIWFDIEECLTLNWFGGPPKKSNPWAKVTQQQETVDVLQWAEVKGCWRGWASSIHHLETAVEKPFRDPCKPHTYAPYAKVSICSSASQHRSVRSGISKMRGHPLAQQWQWSQKIFILLPFLLPDP